MRALLLLALCCGCVTAEYLDGEAESWIGVDVDRLQEEWGSPNDTTEGKDGTKILTYGDECTIVFVIGPDDEVRKATWRGGKRACKRELLWAW